jgi:ParB family chromosome partitioning protein
MPYASISHKTRDSSVPNLKIYPNPDQPRKSFTEEVEAMALSLQQEGQLDPASCLKTACYSMVNAVGELLRSWRGMLEAVLYHSAQRSEDFTPSRLLTSLHRRGLNALDKAETLVAIACDEIQDNS